MQKTAVVAVHYALWVPKYKVYQKRVSRHPVGGGQGRLPMYKGGQGRREGRNRRRCMGTRGAGGCHAHAMKWPCGAEGHAVP